MQRTFATTTAIGALTGFYQAATENSQRRPTVGRTLGDSLSGIFYGALIGVTLPVTIPVAIPLYMISYRAFYDRENTRRRMEYQEEIAKNPCPYHTESSHYQSKYP